MQPACLLSLVSCLSAPLSQAFGLIRSYMVVWRTAAEAQHKVERTRKKGTTGPGQRTFATIYGSECMYRIPNTAGAPQKEGEIRAHRRLLKTMGKRCNGSGD
ncbi:hypothetical protein V8C26DRAFT_360881 [Trichoderma gracile]